MQGARQVLGSTALMQYPRATAGNRDGVCWVSCAGCEPRRSCWALLGPLGDVESQRAAPGAPPAPGSLSSSPSVMGCQELLGHWGSGMELLEGCTSHVSKPITNSVLQGSSSRHCMNQMKIVRWIPANARLQTSPNIRAT